MGDGEEYLYLPVWDLFDDGHGHEEDAAESAGGVPHQIIQEASLSLACLRFISTSGNAPHKIDPKKEVYD